MKRMAAFFLALTMLLGFCVASSAAENTEKVNAAGTAPEVAETAEEVVETAEEDADAAEEPAEAAEEAVETTEEAAEAATEDANISPEWVAALGEAQNAQQLFVVAGVGQTTAYVSMHEKDADGVWHLVMTTPGLIGKYGLGKEAEGDGKTPVGVFSFNCAFGIAEDPGCALAYRQVTEDDYWSGDQREGYHYNEMVSIRDLPDLNAEDSEHITDYVAAYQYCLNISYNEAGTPGLGSAIFLHCFREDRPYTGGCVALPKEKMLTVMQTVQPDCVVVIDSLKNLSPETWEEWGLGSEAGTEPEIDYGTSE